MSAVAPMVWKNIDNASFYDEMPMADFMDHAVQAGIAKGEDLEHIKGLILQSKSILEVGTGYGRVLKYILQLGFDGLLSAVERNAHYAGSCKKQFGSRVNIYNEDVLEWKEDIKCDLILWMWSSISEFQPQEQANLISNLSKALSKSGSLIVDVITSASKANLELSQECAYYHIRGESGYQEDVYMPSVSEVLAYASSCFRGHRLTPYETKNGVSRTIIQLFDPCD